MKKYKVEGMQGRVTGFEDYLDLATMVQFNMSRHQFGAFQNRKGKVDQFVYGFAVKGIHSFHKGSKLEAAFNNLEEGLKSLPPGESLRLHLISESTDTLRQRQLKELEEQAPTEQLKYFIRSEQDRVRELTDEGLREPKRLICYCTYTPNGPKASNDWFSPVTKWARPLWDKFTDAETEQEQMNAEMLYSAAYNNGFLPWLNFLRQQLGLGITPLSTKELWAELWGRFNDCEPIEVPQQITVTSSELTETVNYDIHATALMTPEGLPIFDRQWVYLKKRFTGVMVLQGKPSGWSTAERQLHYLWKALTSDLNHDCEIVCELTAASPRLAEEATLKLAKQSNTKSKVATDRGSLDIKADVHKEKAVEAAISLLDGQSPIYVSTVFLLHRETANDLTMDCDSLIGEFRAPTQVVREEEIAWRLWLDTLPIVQRKMLAKVPTNRRLTYLSGEVPGVAPFLQTNSPDRNGFELIAECGTPILIDLINNNRNLALIATMRSGKSVTAAGIINDALALSIPVVALDYPKPDGSSTFTDYTHFMEENGAYFDISEQSNNLFEMPDIRHLPPEKQRERFFDWRDFLSGAVMTLMGVEESNARRQVKTVINFALSAFFNDPLIQQRYQEAVVGGFGSDDWPQMPTLRDFLKFCTKEHLPLDKVQGDGINQTLQQIQLQLEYWLNSRVGRAISQPSSFPTGAPLLVFALRGLSDSEDAEILALSAYSAALRRALENPVSIFFIDESPILFQFPSIARLVGKLCSNGAKSGIRVILSAQGPGSIAKSVVGEQIFDNITTRLIGRLESSAVDSFVEHLGYQRTDIEPNADDGFLPQKDLLYSPWLLDEGGTLTQCRYYAPKKLLGAVANDTKEQEARTAIMAQYDCPYEGLTEFSNRLVTSIRTGEKINVEPKEKPEQGIDASDRPGDRQLVVSGTRSA